ncbi:MAG: family acetyltransferase [Gemmatimonadetes bacterium]|nr:family acetyltransferase [Gemmatimonadota bacterium]
MTEPALSVSIVEGGEDPGNNVILDGLRTWNEAQLGRTARPVPVSVFVRDEKGDVVGGLIGQMLFDWLYVDKLWLPDALRGTGMGSTVLDAAERHAIERGCRWAHLQTLEHQALPFYEGRGYTVFGVLEGYPPGSRRHYLRKTLVPGDDRR